LPFFSILSTLYFFAFHLKMAETVQSTHPHTLNTDLFVSRRRNTSLCPPTTSRSVQVAEFGG